MKQAIQGEAEIVWVLPREKAVQLPYVRESLTDGLRRKPSIRGRLVAYAVLRRPTGRRFPLDPHRRFWYLAEHDPYPDRGGPIQGVDPRSIKAGEPSLEMTAEQHDRLGQFAKSGDESAFRRQLYCLTQSALRREGI